MYAFVKDTVCVAFLFFLRPRHRCDHSTFPFTFSRVSTFSQIHFVEFEPCHCYGLAAFFWLFLISQSADVRYTGPMCMARQKSGQATYGRAAHTTTDEDFNSFDEFSRIKCIKFDRQRCVSSRHNRSLGDDVCRCCFDVG